MTEATITLNPEPEAPAAEPATNEHDVAIAEAEAAAEIAVAEIEAEAREAEAERVAEAIETAGERTEQEELQWLRERVAFLEGQQASPPTLIAETVTLETEAEPSTPPNSSEAETMTDPAEVAEADPTISTPQSTSGETSETPTDHTPESADDAPAVEAPPARPRKRRLLI